MVRVILLLLLLLAWLVCLFVQLVCVYVSLGMTNFRKWQVLYNRKDKLHDNVLMAVVGQSVIFLPDIFKKYEKCSEGERKITQHNITVNDRIVGVFWSLLVSTKEQKFSIANFKKKINP